MDFIGQLPETATGKEDILVLVDPFTKWIEGLALKDQTAKK